MATQARVLLLALVMALALSGCEFIPKTPPAVPTAPGTTATPSILFKDDFSKTDSGWSQRSLPEGQAGYADGVYRIRVDAANGDVWGRPGLDLGDVSIEVDALKVGGPRDNRFGVVCRMQDERHFYVFLISSDGYYGIGKVSDNQYQLIAAEAMLPSEKIHQGSDPNRIRVDCLGQILALYVNGELIGVTSDGSYSHGDIGLIAGAYGSTGTEIFFDNLIVRKP